MSNEVTKFDATNMLMNPEAMQAIMHLAETMANGTIMTPDHLRGKPADCTAVVMQAARWKMDPFVVASKTFPIKGKLGYESQLIVAAMQSTGAVRSRFHYQYGGTWPNGQDAWVKCGAILAGEDEIQWGEELYVNRLSVKNSPLWKDDPKQQGAYLAAKRWSRIYAPGAILGVYSADELASEQQEYVPQERDVTPQKEVNSIDDFLEQADPVESLEEGRETYTALLAEFDGAKTLEDLSAAIQGSAKAGDQLNDEQKTDLSKAAKSAKQRIQSQTVEFD